MKDWLVDVPVQVNIWTRPDCQAAQFAVLRQARPRTLFVVSDGGRNAEEWACIRQNRKLYDEQIDWDCDVHKLYFAENHGMYDMIKRYHAFVWEHVDRCIFLEDDIIPSVSFFRYCAELLERYLTDTRVNVICGFNHVGAYDGPESDYFFSKEGSIWGIATWRRVYRQFYDFDYGKDSYTMRLLLEQTAHNRTFRKRIQAYATEKYYEGHEAAIEFFLEFGIYGQHQLQIIPTKNLVSNYGCDANAAHAAELRVLPRATRRMFRSETYELAFPLKHPKYVIPDTAYERMRNRVLGYNRPVLHASRKVEGWILQIKAGGMRNLLCKLMRKLSSVKRPER